MGENRSHLECADRDVGWSRPLRKRLLERGSRDQVLPRKPPGGRVQQGWVGKGAIGRRVTAGAMALGWSAGFVWMAEAVGRIVTGGVGGSPGGRNLGGAFK